ncbi:MAG: cation-transporting P-type ATPase [Desulfomonilaceae bacterium]
MLKLIHNHIPGRVRYKVEGLYRCVSLKYRLEMVLPQDEDVRRVSASILTGNVLIIFNPDCNPRKIELDVERIVLAYLRETGGNEAGGGSSSTDDSALTPVTDLSIVRAAKDRAEHLASKARKSKPWHMFSVKFVLSSLKSSRKRGLSAEAVNESRRKYGINVLPEPQSRSKLGIFIDQFNSFPVALLGAAAGLSLVTGGLADAIIIVAVVGINAVIGFVTENEAEKIISSLKRLIRPSAQIIRGGSLQEIPAEQVLVGDVLLLKPGTYVTGDARIIEATHLTVDESVLTGESMPVTKNSSPLKASRVPLADRTNMVYSGTLITGGQGLAVVVAIGTFSEVGQIQSLLAEAEAPETPIERQLTRIGNQLVLISGAVCGLVFFIGLIRGNGFLQMLKTAISLAVAAVPEGLPAVATTTLALGINNMRKHKVLIRNLDAICTLGSVQTICFDKTGTITHNRMSVLTIYSGMERIQVSEGRFFRQESLFDPSQSDEVLKLIHISVLCNETQIEVKDRQYVLNGSPTENALIQMAISGGIPVQSLRDQHPVSNIQYRSDNRQFMITEHVSEDKKILLAIKGNPVEVLAKCKNQITNGAVIALADEDRDAIEVENDSMAGDALRVLGVAYAIRNSDEHSEGENGFTWLGLVGMADPIRSRVKESIVVFHKAGLETVMVTGDQSPTAYAVGKELGLSNGRPLEILDSTNLTSTKPAVLKALSKEVHVFSRVSPSNKLQIVQALQSSGKVVAMTGDGINDGPALKAADIGIAMGRAGTDVARDVADVVLEEDDLETLIIAISDGRTIYNNIRKTLRYLLATNFSEIQVMFVAGALGLGYPLNAMQLLWINLVSDIFPGLALALEPAEPNVMSQPPRDSTAPIVEAKDFKRIGFEAATMTATSLAAYGFGVMKYGMGPAAGTLAFQSLTTSQILHALSCRSETRTIFDRQKSTPNKYLNVAVIGSLGLQLASQLIPGLRTLLGTTPITLLDGLVIGAASVIPLFINEATKKGSADNK